jgi:hypothetical protein
VELSLCECSSSYANSECCIFFTLLLYRYKSVARVIARRKLSGIPAARAMIVFRGDVLLDEWLSIEVGAGLGNATVLFIEDSRVTADVIVGITVVGVRVGGRSWKVDIKSILSTE